MSKSILIVDDDDAILETIADYLKESGYNVLVATNGEEGSDILKNEMVDLVITDMYMAKLNGLRLLEHIRAEKSEIPVILMTGYELSKDEIAYFPYAPNAYIIKPFPLEKLSKSIENLLNIQK